MGMLTVQGYYKDGQLALPDSPAGVPRQGKVLVTFLDESTGRELEAEQRRKNEARERAGRELIEMMRKGMDLGGPPYPTREEIYDIDERFKRFDRGDA